MLKRIRRLLCAITRHRFERTDIDCKIDVENNIVTVTQTCRRCGKQFTFTAPND